MAKKQKILIVDDEEQIVTAYGDHFAREGYEIGKAYDGAEALEKVKEFTPDIILLDILMPKLDGLSALKQLKKDPETRDIPVIILTNLDQKEDVLKGVQEGGILYFVKARTSLEVLSKWIRDLLRE